MRSWASSAICLSRAKIPALIHSSRRSRMVVAGQVQPAIGSYEQPNRRTWTQFFEDDAVGDPRPVAAGRMRGDVDRAWRQQRGELVPQRFQQP